MSPVAPLTMISHKFQVFFIISSLELELPFLLRVHQVNLYQNWRHQWNCTFLNICGLDTGNQAHANNSLVRVIFFAKSMNINCFTTIWQHCTFAFNYHSFFFTTISFAMNNTLISTSPGWLNGFSKMMISNALWT